jgi:uncharacterized damage-inducible protein DinB
MRNLFLVISIFYGGIAASQSIDSLFLETAITKLKNSKDYTLQAALLMPEGKFLFKPTPDEMSFGEQLIHISANMGWLSNTYLNGKENPVSKEARQFKQKEEILSVVTKTYDYAIATLKSFDPTQLSDRVKFFAGEKNKLQIINLLSDHQTHHRGQIMVYLRLNGIKPPDYTGW